MQSSMQEIPVLRETRPFFWAAPSFSAIPFFQVDQFGSRFLGPTNIGKQDFRQTEIESVPTAKVRTRSNAVAVRGGRDRLPRRPMKMNEESGLIT